MPDSLEAGLTALDQRLGITEAAPEGTTAESSAQTDDAFEQLDEILGEKEDLASSETVAPPPEPEASRTPEEHLKIAEEEQAYIDWAEKAQKVVEEGLLKDLSDPDAVAKAVKDRDERAEEARVLSWAKEHAQKRNDMEYLRVENALNEEWEDLRDGESADQMAALDRLYDNAPEAIPEALGEVDPYIAQVWVQANQYIRDDPVEHNALTFLQEVSYDIAAREQRQQQANDLDIKDAVSGRLAELSSPNLDPAEKARIEEARPLATQFLRSSPYPTSAQEARAMVDAAFKKADQQIRREQATVKDSFVGQLATMDRRLHEQAWLRGEVDEEEEGAPGDIPPEAWHIDALEELLETKPKAPEPDVPTVLDAHLNSRHVPDPEWEKALQRRGKERQAERERRRRARQW
jgi:hypothetical protein